MEHKGTKTRRRKVRSKIQDSGFKILTEHEDTEKFNDNDNVNLNF